MTHIKRMAGAIEGELMPQTLDSIDNKEQTQSHGVSLAQAALSAIPPQFAHQPLDMVGVIFFELGYFGSVLYGYSCDTSNTHPIPTQMSMFDLFGNAYIVK